MNTEDKKKALELFETVINLEQTEMSNMVIGVAGMTVEMACCRRVGNGRRAAAERRSCRTMSRTPQFHTVDEENRHRGLTLADMIEESVLQVLRLFTGHCCDPTSDLDRLPRSFRGFARAYIGYPRLALREALIAYIISTSLRYRAVARRGKLVSAAGRRCGELRPEPQGGRAGPPIADPPPVDGDDRGGDGGGAGKERLPGPIGLRDRERSFAEGRGPRRATMSRRVARVTPRRIAWSACRVNQRAVGGDNPGVGRGALGDETITVDEPSLEGARLARRLLGQHVGQKLQRLYVRVSPALVGQRDHRHAALGVGLADTRIERFRADDETWRDAGLRKSVIAPRRAARDL